MAGWLIVLLVTLCFTTLVPADPLDNRKDTVLVKKGNKEVDPRGYQGDTAEAKISDPTHLNAKYAGSPASPLKGKAGSGGADRSADNAVFNVKDSSGKTARVDDDKKKKTAKITDSGKDNINANPVGNSDVVADVKGGNGKNAKVKGHREGDVATVQKEGDPTVFKINGVNQQEGDRNDLLAERSDKKEVQEVEKSAKHASDGRISHLGVQESNQAAKNLPIGDTNKIVVDKSASAKGSQSKITAGKSVGISHGVDSNSNFGSFGSDCSTTTSETQAQPCAAADELNDNGYKIYDDIKWEYPPTTTDKSGNPTYEFPGCFIAKAGIHIPQGVDKNDIGIQIIAWNQLVGTMQCDQSAECQDRSTANQPTPPCFHCNYCAAPKQQIDYNLESSSNFCQITGGQRFDLQWTVCPPKQSKGNFKPFNKQLIGGERHDGDIDMVVKLFHREKSGGSSRPRQSGPNCSGFNAILNAAQCLGSLSPVQNANGLSWELKACRRATMAYSAKCGQLGSVGSDRGGGNSPRGGSSPFGKFGNLFGGK